jgi:hypothetical protein
MCFSWRIVDGVEQNARAPRYCLIENMPLISVRVPDLDDESSASV